MRFQTLVHRYPEPFEIALELGSDADSSSHGLEINMIFMAELRFFLSLRYERLIDI